MAQEALLASGMKFDGVLNCECDLKISGYGSGEINSSHKVYIDSNGSYEGKIIANKVSIKGKMKGSIVAEDVSIEAGGELKGDFTCKVLSIDSKGYFEGNSTMIKEDVGLQKGKKRMQEPNTDEILL